MDLTTFSFPQEILSLLFLPSSLNPA
jgi:hypothetical protein